MKTLDQFIKAARILLQDTIPSYRYSDEEFKLALELAFDEARRIRPDFFIREPYPTDIIDQPGSYEPPVPVGYQSAFLFYMCGHVQLRDQEDTQDNRATIFLNKFVAQLLTTAA